MDVSGTSDGLEEASGDGLCEFTDWTRVASEEHFRQFGDALSFSDPPGELGAVDAVETFYSELHGDNSGTDERKDILSECPSPSLAPEVPVENSGIVLGPQPTVSDQQWQLGVIANHRQFSQQPASLLLPWETGVFAEIFGNAPLLTLPTSVLPEPDSGLMEQVIAAVDAVDNSDAKPSDSCFDKAVRNMQDLEYFENKHRQLELACGQWLELLSCNWFSTGVGEILARDMQKDVTGACAYETLKACFGIKSPQTLLKRAASLRRYFKWHSELRSDAKQVEVSPLPFTEQDVWAFFHWLRDYRIENNRGFTNASAFLETVRFMKFTLELRDSDIVLQSRRLLGFASIERMQKGPTRQAAPLELVHLQRLHEVLQNGSCLMDRLGAGVILICIYGRARWSDLRYIHHVVVEEGRNGFLTLYTAEHKTSAVGARREQYLPLVVPWMGVVHDEWIKTFLDVYLELGLNIFKIPLGPLLPAPRLGGGFAARPLSTPEAATWLRLLLHGTPGCDNFRAHSLKTTLLVWAAKAGLEKEVRAVLGHHASALEGSEVVYSRHLQTRALRKLCMLLHRVRIGLGLEEDPLAPNPFATPCVRTPGVFGVAAQPATPFPAAPAIEVPVDVVEQALEEVNVAGEVEGIKEELADEAQMVAAASQISLFNLDIVDQGVVELDSSSGSESYSESSSSSDDDAVVKKPDIHAYSELVPEGVEFYKHRKSAIVHEVKSGKNVASCGAQISTNLQLMPRQISVRWPKCLKCFPKDKNRIRSFSAHRGY